MEDKVGIWAIPCISLLDRVDRLSEGSLEPLTIDVTGRMMLGQESTVAALAEVGSEKAQTTRKPKERDKQIFSFCEVSHCGIRSSGQCFLPSNSVADSFTLSASPSGVSGLRTLLGQTSLAKATLAIPYPALAVDPAPREC